MSVSFLGAQKSESGIIASSVPKRPTANASSNTKGTYQELITSTAYPAAWILVSIMRPGLAADYLVDISVGAASSEQVVIANLPYSNNTTGSPPQGSFLFPLFIPVGSRLSCRCQCSTGAQAIDVQVTVFAPMFGSERGLGQVETCGAQTGTSLGKTIPGHTSSANTKGTWTELIAATSFAYKWCCLGITHTNVVGALEAWTFDIGVGAGGSEVVVVPDITLASGTIIDAIANGGRSFPLSIPAGTRISARVQCNVTTAAERDIELVLLGVG